MNETQTGAGCRRPPAAARTYRIVHAVMLGLAVSLVACAVVILVPLSVPLPIVLVVTGAILAFDVVFIPLQHSRFRYRITKNEFYVSRGRFILSTVTVAVPHILHAELLQGPLLRVFGLATVRIKMVVGSHELWPIPEDEAEEIRQIILRGAGSVLDAS